MEGGDCILTVKHSDSPDFTGADYDFIDKQLFSLEEGENVEYVRKDAFIEKACEYLMEYEFNDSPTIADRRKRVEDFKKYMENGE